MPFPTHGLGLKGSFFKLAEFISCIPIKLIFFLSKSVKPQFQGKKDICTAKPPAGGLIPFY